MKFSFLILVFVGIIGSLAKASSVSIVVSDKKDTACIKKAGPESTQYLLDTNETLETLNLYFNLKRNSKFYDAAIANAKIQFCTYKEREIVFQEVINKLNQSEPNKRVFEVIANYYDLKPMKQLIEKHLTLESSSKNFKSNLEKAKSFALKARLKSNHK